jgi:adenosylhomocysteine nucleosidase
MALPMEAREMFSDLDVRFTGVGKVNAVYGLMRLISTARPSEVINLGTAASRNYPRGSLVCCTQFLQADMNVTPLGFAPYQTPFEEEIMLSNGRGVEGLPQAVCGSADFFAEEPGAGHYQIMDMEAYALAKLCHLENIPFTCIKYISDNGNSQASNDWGAALEDASHKLRAAYNGLAASPTPEFSIIQPN